MEFLTYTTFLTPRVPYMAIIDYISGMTDVYALDIYQKINGISLPIV
jgi:dGTP triphosphohydrolase